MNKVLRFNKSMFVYALCIIPFVWLEYVELTIPSISAMFDVVKIILMFALAIFMLKKQKISKMIFVMGLYFLVMIGITYMRHYNIKGVINTGVSTLFFCLLTDFFMKKNTDNTLTAFSLVFQLLIYINFFTMIMFPNGIYATSVHPVNWFLGYKNAHILYVLPSLFFITLNCFRKGKKINLYYLFYIFISGLSILMGGSSTGIIGYFLFILGSMLIWLKKDKLITVKKALCVNAIAFFGIIVFQVQNTFTLILQSIMHKNLNFTGRTNIWATTIELIKKNFLMGYGVQPSSIRVLIYKNINAVNSHNEFLEILYHGGIILGSIFFYIIFMVCKKLNTYKEHVVAKLGTVLLFTYFVMMLMESYRYSLFMYLFIILYNMDLIISDKGDNTHA